MAKATKEKAPLLTGTALATVKAAIVKAAKEIGADEEFTREIEINFEADERNKVRSRVLYHIMRKKHGKLMDAWPVPGTVYKPGMNEPFDVFSISKPKAKGVGTTTEETSTYKLLALELPIVQEYSKILKEIATSRTAPGSLPDKSKYKAPSDIRDTDESKYNGRINSAVRQMIEVGKIHHILLALKPLKMVKAEWIVQVARDPDTLKVLKDGKGNPIVNPVDAPVCLKIKSLAGDEATELFTVARFIRLDVPAAIEEAGGPDELELVHLTNTLKREEEPPEDTQFPNLTVTNWVGGIYEVNEWLTNNANEPAILKVLRSSDDEGDEARIAFEDLYLAMAEFRSKPGVMQKIRKSVANRKVDEDNAATGKNTPKESDDTDEAATGTDD